MKNILVVSVGTPTGEAMANEIFSIFKDYAHTETCLCHQLPKKTEGRDIIIFSSKYSEDLCSQYKCPGISYLSARRVIDYTKIREIIELERDTKVLLVNDCEETAVEAIDQLIETGLNTISYVPFFPGCKVCPEIPIAITPGELSCVPKYIKKVIDIGVRTLDIRTIYDLMMLLNADHLFTQSLVARYLKEIVNISKSFSESHKKALKSERLLETIIDSVDSGIAYVGSDHRIVRTNLIFETILNRKKEDLEDKDFDQLFYEKNVFLREGSFIIPADGRTVLFDVKEIEAENTPDFMITANYADKINKMEYQIKKDSRKNSAVKLYHFSDYLTWDEKCKNMVSLAEKFAGTDGTVLIQGESGTGKEILAQGIHSFSGRHKYPFIAVNITALTQTLIESELFGYEEGSFTGAKKGGKPGIFEMADQGTVFIDEIGDASMDFQVKLLRVLERKSIRRVGGTEEIPINVRIIVATNKELPVLIEKGLFREDLFFRLNILPLHTIPLRQRKKDIIPLMTYFLSPYFESGVLKQLINQELQTFFESYMWKGNVRELINVVEYLRLTYEGGAITLSSLPTYMHISPKQINNVHLGEEEFIILSKILEYGNHGIGRNKLHAAISDGGIVLGTGKIRTILKRLEEKNLIEQSSYGCLITEKGKLNLS